MTALQENLPMVSVLAPCRNEEKFIENAIRTILENDYPADKMEVLVLDGMSTDGTREKVLTLAKQDGRVKLIDNPHKIVPTAMNIGVQMAKGEYIVRIDCHTKFPPDYIRKCIEVHLRTQADNVGGYCQTFPGADTEVAKAIAAATSCIFGIGNSQFRLTGPEQEVDTVPFGTFKKELLIKIGGYDERLVRNQDIELNSRIRRAGGRIVISPEIKLIYYNRATLRGLWQQSFSNGLWNPYTIWLTGRGLSLRHFIPMFFVLTLCCFFVAGIVWLPALIVLGGCMLLYSIVALIFAFKVAESRDVSTFLVWSSFWVLHISYGLGSLGGILTIPFKFPKRRERHIGEVLSDRLR